MPTKKKAASSSKSNKLTANRRGKSTREREAIRGGSAKTTTSHRTIQRWAEERRAQPATVKGTSEEDAGILRLDFPGYSGKDSLEPISWEDFFDKFDNEKLAFLYQEKTTSGRTSRFCKFVNRASGSKGNG